MSVRLCHKDINTTMNIWSLLQEAERWASDILDNRLGEKNLSHLLIIKWLTSFQFI